MEQREDALVDCQRLSSRLVGDDAQRHVVVALRVVVSLPPDPARLLLSLHDALPIFLEQLAMKAFQTFLGHAPRHSNKRDGNAPLTHPRSEEHTSELQSLRHLVCRLLLATKNLPTSLRARGEGPCSSCSLRHGAKGRRPRRLSTPQLALGRR